MQVVIDDALATALGVSRIGQLPELPAQPGRGNQREEKSHLAVKGKRRFMLRAKIGWSLSERSYRSVACYMRIATVRRFGTAGGQDIERSNESSFPQSPMTNTASAST
ncbi:hypothetical protein HHA01_18020 [Halomonas halmophila]|uniref:Transposase DDE domain-containing protein n=1 Tax=Halomonas halmophila TaxID=252 RepID=A0A4Y4F2E9_9GAMM|nr:hypothetical protein HHA01_18020 [Halomonas halmophila]